MTKRVIVSTRVQLTIELQISGVVFDDHQTIDYMNTTAQNVALRQVDKWINASGDMLEIKGTPAVTHVFVTTEDE